MPRIPSPAAQHHPLAQLSLADIDDLAGSAVMRRGWNTHRDGLVDNLAQTPDGQLLAWVDGTERYATRVWMDNGDVECECSCPFESFCKHAVAMIFAVGAMAHDGASLPLARKNDIRLRLTAGAEDELDPSDDDERDLQVVAGTPEFLRALSRQELLTLIQELLTAHPEVATHLATRQLEASADIPGLLSALDKELDHARYAVDWRDPWEYQEHQASVERIPVLMSSLLAAGGAEELAAKATTYFRRMSDMVGERHWDECLGTEAAPVIEIILKAVKASTWSPSRRLIWALDIISDDPYCLAGSIEDYVAGRHSRAAWSDAADHLLERLDRLPADAARTDRSNAYARERLAGLATRALENARRSDEIEAVLIGESTASGSWQPLVEHLIAAKRHDEAEDSIAAGIAAIRESQPGTASRLRGLLREIRRKKRDWPMVAALRALEFHERPTVEAFRACREATAKVGEWEPVRLTLLSSLETGKPPWNGKGWPLPTPPGFAVFGRRRSRADYPDHDALIEIAMHEKDPERVLLWYDRRQASGRWFGAPSERVAGAVCDFAPKRAVAIWKELAERQIKLTKPEAYQVAGHLMRRIKKTLSTIGKGEEWERYLATIREEHRRKRRLMEVLGRV